MLPRNTDASAASAHCELSAAALAASLLSETDAIAAYVRDNCCVRRKRDVRRTKRALFRWSFSYLNRRQLSRDTAASERVVANSDVSRLIWSFVALDVMVVELELALCGAADNSILGTTDNTVRSMLNGAAVWKTNWLDAGDTRCFHVHLPFGADVTRIDVALYAPGRDKLTVEERTVRYISPRRPASRERVEAEIMRARVTGDRATGWLQRCSSWWSCADAAAQTDCQRSLAPAPRMEAGQALVDSIEEFRQTCVEGSKIVLTDFFHRRSRTTSPVAAPLKCVVLPWARYGTCVPGSNRLDGEGAPIDHGLDGSADLGTGDLGDYVCDSIDVNALGIGNDVPLRDDEWGERETSVLRVTVKKLYSDNLETGLACFKVFGRQY